MRAMPRKKGKRRVTVAEALKSRKLMRKAKRVHRSRSKRARRTDESRTGRIPKYFETWLRNPGRYDLPGVDTADVGKREKERRRKLREAAKRKMKKESKKQSLSLSIARELAERFNKSRYARINQYFYMLERKLALRGLRTLSMKSKDSWKQLPGGVVEEHIATKEGTLVIRWKRKGEKEVVESVRLKK